MSTLDRARAAVMERLGWEDDRDQDECAGALWDAATEAAQAVIDVIEADRALTEAAQAVTEEPYEAPKCGCGHPRIDHVWAYQDCIADDNGPCPCKTYAEEPTR